VETRGLVGPLRQRGLPGEPEEARRRGAEVDDRRSHGVARMIHPMCERRSDMGSRRKAFELTPGMDGDGWFLTTY
jgi:hypothetical protein